MPALLSTEVTAWYMVVDVTGRQVTPKYSDPDDAFDVCERHNRMQSEGDFDIIGFPFSVEITIEDPDWKELEL